MSVQIVITVLHVWCKLMAVIIEILVIIKKIVGIFPIEMYTDVVYDSTWRMCVTNGFRCKI